MKAWVVYDSFFGNTEKIAQKIGESLGEGEEVSVYRVSQVPHDLPDGLALLIVGSPTRQFSQTAAIRDYIKNLPGGKLQKLRVAVFDTRIDVNDIHSSVGRFFVGNFGYAAKKIAKGLQSKGAQLTVSPEGFFVADSEGPLKPGELERAANWARSITGK